MPNILVFPCGSEIGLEVYRSLNHDPSFNLLGASTYPDHGRFVYDNYVESVPHFDDPKFIDEIRRVVHQYEIDFIIPGHDGALLRLAQHQMQLNAQVVTSPLKTCTIGRSKLKTYHFFEKHLNVPKVFNTQEVNSFPVFLKPEVGQGSRGTHIALNLEEVNFYLRKDPTLLILQYLPGEEATVDCFTDRNGVLRYFQGRIRSRIRNGISVNSSQVNDLAIGSIAKVINAHLNLRGAWFFQIKKDEKGQWFLLEFAPRIASTSCVPRVAGVNLVEWSIRDWLEEAWQPTPHGLLVETDRALYSRYKIGIDYDVLLIYGIQNITGTDPNLPKIMHIIYTAKVLKTPVLLLIEAHDETIPCLQRLSIEPALFDASFSLEAVNEELKKFKFPVCIHASNAPINEALKLSGIPVFGLAALEALT